MSAQPASRTGFKFLLSVRVGPDRGATFQLLPPRVTIGRGSENNVAFTDPKVSRNAAVIEFAMEQITITDVSSRSSMSVNGTASQNASIRNGDLIRIGATEFQFIVEAVQLSPSLPSLSVERGLAPQAQGGVIPFPPPSNASNAGPSRVQFGGAAYERPPAKSQGGRSTFYLIVAGVGGLLIWLLNSSPVEKPVEQVLRTTEAVEKDITSSEERSAELVKRRTFKNDEERARYEEAQRHYLSGFRDYQKGQWLRAMRSFETARAIDPEHELALRYMRLAEKQRDEEVAVLTLEGRRYKEKNMYQRCSAALDKAMDLMPNKADVKYKEAKTLKEECDLLDAERFH